MDKDEIKGKAKDIAGRAERQVGEWTGDSDAQAEGARKQVEGKVQNTFGKVKDALKHDDNTDDRDLDTDDVDRKRSA